VPGLRTYGKRWRILSVESKQDKVLVRCEVPVLIFTDDLVVTLSTSPETTAQTAHAGRCSLGFARRAQRPGRNRRHVRQLLQRLDQLTTSEK
jgi:hypothetical protein